MTGILQATASGEVHGLINTMPNNVPFDDYKHFSPKHKEEMIKLKKENARMVKMEYINRKGRHERLAKAFCLGAGEPIQQYNLIPGKVYELPKGFVDEVNRLKNMTRSGLVSLDGQELNKDGSPLERDVEADWEHKLIPVNY